MSRTPRPCGICPLRNTNGWCAHLATTRPPNAPSCEWGRRKMDARCPKKTVMISKEKQRH